MKHPGLAIVIACAALAVGSPTFAQDARADTKQPYRSWDAGGGIGFRPSNFDRDVVVPPGTWDAQVTRYWTAHVTTTFGISSAESTSYYTDYILFDGSGYQYTRRTPSAAAINATLGYQFLENVFVHPYVAGGVRVVWIDEAVGFSSSKPPYDLLTVSDSSPQPQARPVIAGGFKSYFDNGRAFMRSELQLVAEPNGSSRTVIRIGVGFDF